MRRPEPGHGGRPQPVSGDVGPPVVDPPGAHALPPLPGPPVPRALTLRTAVRWTNRPSIVAPATVSPRVRGRRDRVPSLSCPLGGRISSDEVRSMVQFATWTVGDEWQGKGGGQVRPEQGVRDP